MKMTKEANKLFEPDSGKAGIETVFYQTESAHHGSQPGDVYGGNRNSHHAGCLYLDLSSEKNPREVLRIISLYLSYCCLRCLFANFAEAIAEARGKAQADSLRKTREDTPAKKIFPVGEIFVDEVKIVPSSQLRKGDVFYCEAGDTIPMDGEIIEGLATIDESAITGESAPVIREAGGDKSSVTGGTKVLSDQIKVKVTTNPGESFLDKMIALVEGASSQKTPNEIALTILLAGFTIIFVIVCVTLKPFGDYANTPITIAAFISLFVCLIPTTIGGLLSAIGIAGMDRALRANVITKSGKAVETAGDLDTLLLDKTGTITIGNRKATNFWPSGNVDEKVFIEACALASLADETPEGKSIVELGGMKPDSFSTNGAQDLLNSRRKQEAAELICQAE